MFSGKRHPNDDALVRRYMADRGLDALSPEDERVVRHVETCQTCGVRYQDMCVNLDDAGRAAFDAADAVFSPEQLTHQRDRILRRLDATGARVLAFPANDPGQRDASWTRPRWGWVAAAALAGLLVGTAVGRIVHFGADAQTEVATAVQPARLDPSAGAANAQLKTVASRYGEEQLLSDVEVAISAPHTPELEAIDAMTLRIQGPPPKD